MDSSNSVYSNDSLVIIVFHTMVCFIQLYNLLELKHTRYIGSLVLTTTISLNGIEKKIYCTYHIISLLLSKFLNLFY